MSTIWTWLKKPALLVGVILAGLVAVLIASWNQARKLRAALKSSQRSLDAEREHSAELKDIAEKTAAELAASKARREIIETDREVAHVEADTARNAGADAMVRYWNDLMGRSG